MIFDILGALFSLVSTYFFIRLNNKAWIVGLIATCVNGGLYWYKAIYADMGLELFYFFMMIYGWYKWQATGNNKYKQPTMLKHLSLRHWLILASVFISTFTLIYLFLSFYTHSSVPKLDALTTTLSLIAQWLMCHKIIMTWIFWFITDAFYVGLYLTKELPFHALLMLVYTGMAVTGYIVWARVEKVKTPIYS